MRQPIEAQIVQVASVPGGESGILSPPGCIADHRKYRH
jgi:hypothetical protein